MAQRLPDAGWHKSSYSNDYDNACVEVFRSAQGVRVRDSKDQGGPQLAFSADAWMAFLQKTHHLPLPR